KLTVIFLFIIGGAFYVRPENWTPFVTNGLAGIYQGAFLIFLAYIGFDAISTVAEETKDPQVNMPIGIIGTLLICMVVYVLVAAVLTGMFPFSEIKGNEGFIAAPIAYSLRTIGRNYMALLVSLGSLAGLFSVLLVLQLGGSRILFSMSRDKLLSSIFSKVHKKYQTPFVTTLLLGLFVVVGTCFFDLEASAHLCNIGTITSFIAVSLGVIAFRYKEPNIKRSFKIPFMPLIPLLGVISCSWIVIKGVPLRTFIFYLCWIFMGILIYACYGYRKANLK
ncbi:MAG: amino acid permease, partial [bacterium]|nr:amino acid permease [bacterium]